MSNKQDTTKSSQGTNIGSENKAFQCQICAKNFGNKSHLNLHLKGVHENLKPFNCDLCAAAFLNYSGLTTHITTVHQKIKPLNEVFPFYIN